MLYELIPRQFKEKPEAVSYVLVTISQKNPPKNFQKKI